MTEESNYTRASVNDVPPELAEVSEILHHVVSSLQRVLPEGVRVTLVVQPPEDVTDSGLFLSTEDDLTPVANEMLRAQASANQKNH